MGEFATKIPKAQMVASKCAAIVVLRRSRPKSRSVASANSTGVATLSAKRVQKMSNLLSVNNFYAMLKHDMCHMY